MGAAPLQLPATCPPRQILAPPWLYAAGQIGSQIISCLMYLTLPGRKQALTLGKGHRLIAHSAKPTISYPDRQGGHTGNLLKCRPKGGREIPFGVSPFGDNAATGWPCRLHWSMFLHTQAGCGSHPSCIHSPVLAAPLQPVGGQSHFAPVVVSEAFSVAVPKAVERKPLVHGLQHNLFILPIELAMDEF